MTTQQSTLEAEGTQPVAWLYKTAAGQPRFFTDKAVMEQYREWGFNIVPLCVGRASPIPEQNANDLAAELWAIAQGRGPMQGVIAVMAKLLVSHASDPWHQAVLEACMSTEGNYVEAFPEQTVAQLIAWHRADAIYWAQQSAKCRKCGGEMRTGTALAQTYAGSEDLGEVVTMSPGGPGKLIGCNKCAECGWSVSKCPNT